MYDESYTQCACYSYKQSTSKQCTVYQEYVYHYGMQTMYNAQKLHIYMYRTHRTTLTICTIYNENKTLYKIYTLHRNN